MKISKSIYFIAAICVALSGFFASCTKTEDELQPIEESRSDNYTSQGASNCAEVMGLVTKVGDRLKVMNGEHLQDLCGCIEDAVDQYDPLGTINFDENQPYIDFENSKEFSSLRAVVESDIVHWENIPVQTGLEYPGNQYMAPTSLLTILTPNCEILVDDEVVNFCSGSPSIVNTTYNTDEFANGDERLDFCPGSGCCPFWYNSELFTFPNNSDRRIRITNYSFAYPVLGLVLSTQGGRITSFKRRNGIWGNGWYRSNQKIKILSTGGNARRLSSCNMTDSFNDYHNSFRNRKSRERSNIKFGGVTRSYYENDICTHGEVKNGIYRVVCSEN